MTDITSGLLKSVLFNIKISNSKQNKKKQTEKNRKRMKTANSKTIVNVAYRKKWSLIISGLQ